MADAALAEHPIFLIDDSATLGQDTNGTAPPETDGQAATRPRNTMLLRGADLILAVGKEIRMANVTDTKAQGTSATSYKTLHCPHIDFNVKQLSLSPEGKFLAVAGDRDLAVIILPRPTYARSTTMRVECKTMRVGRYYHGVAGAPNIAKIAWHPWGRGGSCLLVLTADGIIREYDVSSEVEEPLQAINVVPQRLRNRGFSLGHDDEQAVSFCFGRGTADWGPLTLYVLTRSGNIHAIAPFLPTHADVPLQYLLALETSVKFKRDVFLASGASATSTSESLTYDYQFKYVSSLVKQSNVPPDGKISPTHFAHVKRPTTGLAAGPPLRQGPFLLQPEPEEPEDMIREASDILYFRYTSPDTVTDNDSLDNAASSSYLDVVAVAHSDGRVDLSLDLDKVEAAWDLQQHLDVQETPLPALYVLETVDLGLLEETNEAAAMPLLRENVAALHLDPGNPHLLYVSHSLGVHTLDIKRWANLVSVAMFRDKAAEKKVGYILLDVLDDHPETNIIWLLNTFAPEDRSSAPIISTIVVDHPYLGYNLLALTEAYELVNIDLSAELAEMEEQSLLAPESFSTGPPAYVTLMAKEGAGLYRPPALPTLNRKIPADPANKQMTTDTLRKFGQQSDQVERHIRTIEDATTSLRDRAKLQRKELSRQVEALGDLRQRLDILHQKGQDLLQGRVPEILDQQQSIARKVDRMLQNALDNSSLVLSEAEVEWFAELARMHSNVVGEGVGESLKERAEKVVGRHGLLRKELSELKVSEKEAETPAPSLGTSQIRGIRTSLAAEAKMLERAKRKADSVTAILEETQNE